MSSNVVSKTAAALSIESGFAWLTIPNCYNNLIPVRIADLGLGVPSRRRASRAAADTVDPAPTTQLLSERLQTVCDAQ